VDPLPSHVFDYLHKESRILQNEKGTKESALRKKDRLHGTGPRKYAAAAADAFMARENIPALRESILHQNKLRAELQTKKTASARNPAAVSTAAASAAAASAAAASAAGVSAADVTTTAAANTDPNSQSKDQHQHAKVVAKAMKSAGKAKNATAGKSLTGKKAAAALRTAIVGKCFYDSGDEDGSGDDDTPSQPTMHIIRAIDNMTKYRLPVYDEQYAEQVRHVCTGECPTGTGHDRCYDVGFLSTAPVITGTGATRHMIATANADTGDDTTPGPLAKDARDFSHGTWDLEYIMAKLALYSDGKRGSDKKDLIDYMHKKVLAEAAARDNDPEGLAEEDLDYDDAAHRVQVAASYKPSTKKKAQSTPKAPASKRQRTATRSSSRTGSCDARLFTNYSQINGSHHQ
jgi:hypothetical protein